MRSIALFVDFQKNICIFMDLYVNDIKICFFKYKRIYKIERT